MKYCWSVGIFVIVLGIEAIMLAFWNIILFGIIFFALLAMIGAYSVGKWVEKEIDEFKKHE